MGFQINGDWGIYIFISFIYYQSSREKAIMIRIMATNTPNLLLKHNFISDVREFFPPRTTYSHWKVVIYFQSLFFFWPLSRQNAQSQPCVKRIDLTSKRLYNEMASKCLFRVLTLDLVQRRRFTVQYIYATFLEMVHNAKRVHFRKAFLEWWYLLAWKFITALTLNEYIL